jgi:hypothetical protein
MRPTFCPPALASLLVLGCVRTLGGDDDDNVSDDDDATGDDDDATGDDDDVVDDDDATGDDDDTGPPPYDPGLLAGWSFGECWGDCVGNLWLGDDNRVSFQVGGWDGVMTTGASATLNAAGREALDAAEENIDFSSLEPVYGCPDCADGGARSLTWDLGPVLQGTSYEYSNPPEAVIDLHNLVVSMWQAYDACTDGEWFDGLACWSADGGDPAE